MSQGDITIFNEFRLELGKKSHAMPSDVIKLGIVTSAAAPAAAQTTPTWADFSANEVDAGTSYSLGGPTLAARTWALDGNGDVKFDADDIVVAQDATGFTDGRWGILYNSTNPTDMAIGYIDLGGDVSIQGGPLNINFDGTNGIARFGAGTIT